MKRVEQWVEAYHASIRKSIDSATIEERLRLSVQYDKGELERVKTALSAMLADERLRVVKADKIRYYQEVEIPFLNESIRQNTERLERMSTVC